MVSTRKIPRLLISAPQGRSGKTTVTLGLLSALTQQGLKVQAFKKGPDFIDPSWHTRVTARNCRNLDCYMFDEKTLYNSFTTGSREADINIIEGAMGLYDGVDLEGSGSTAQVAKITQSPVILVVDTRRMTRSVAAMVLGFQKFDPAINIAGVILNRVARRRHEKMLRQSIEKYCGIPVVGVIPKNEKIAIPDRHLGLIPASEDERLHAALEEIRKVVAEGVDFDKLMEIANSAAPLEVNGAQKLTCKNPSHLKIGIIRDKVFSFYYPENLESLQANGAELIFIDSIKDKSLPEIDGLFIGGGFPEVFTEELQQNNSLRKDIRELAHTGLPIYAECGGLMYLGRSIKINDKEYDMVGILPFDVEFTDKPQGHGYTRMKVIAANPFFSQGTVIKGHEFHNSRIVNLNPQAAFAFKVERGAGITGEYDGIIYKNVLGCYNHMHSLTIPDWARNFVKAAEEYKKLK